MPLIDLEIVVPSHAEPPGAAAVAALADALARVFGSAPGHTWLRVRQLDRAAYAENGTLLSDAELPVFATVLHAHPPLGAALEAEVAALTLALADALRRPADRVHVQYAPAAAARQAFGGTLVR